MGGWIQSWTVIGSTGNEYKVSTKADGTWGCSCKAWTTARAPKPDCKHIRQKRAESRPDPVAILRRNYSEGIKTVTMDELRKANDDRAVAQIIERFDDDASRTSRFANRVPVVRSTEEAVRELESLERRGRITYAQTKLLRGLRSKLEREQRPVSTAAPDRQKFAPTTLPRRKIRLDD